MAREVSFAMRGDKELRFRLEQLSRQMPERAGRAMVNEAGRQARIAAERTPWKTGALAKSVATSARAEVDGHDVTSRYGFGGGSGELPYAVIQHYANYKHQRGERLWVEKTAKKERGRMLKEIARDLGLI